ncbi:MAG TPA: hypothetical protein VMA77_27790 [Solirubrobacteraceae bacterium]|nr:hypothetical protein [Solirubrobacteraceae bacterium]
MRLEIELIDGGGAGRAGPASDLPPVRIGPHRRRRIDGFELGVLIAFAALSVFVLALDVGRVIFDGAVWTGTDGVYIVDQMQYLAWIQAASHHVLVSNLFVLRSTPADYFQPAVVISGALTALGVPAWLSLLLWKPVAVLAFFFGVRAYARRSLAGLWPRRVVLVLTLFFGCFTYFYGNWSVLGDLFPGFLTWGYVFGLLALAAMVWALVAYDDARLGGSRWWLPGLLGAVATLLHPWNGELLIVLVLGAEAVLLAGRRYRREYVRLTAATVIGTGAAVLYYAILGKADLNWKLAQIASKHSFPFTGILIAVLPLLLPALVAYRTRPATFLAAATRTWPVAAFGIFLLSGTSLGATPLHSFQGITLPLSVLAVEGLQLLGWRRLRHPVLIGAVLVALFTIPTTVEELKIAHNLSAPTPGNANFITSDENAALNYLASNKEPGSVLTRSYLGAAVPGRTGRHTYVGDCLWSEPGCLNLTWNAQSLFSGTLSQSVARRFVLSSGARFVLADCETTADMRTLLGPIIRSTHSFGCAAVYEVD